MPKVLEAVAGPGALMLYLSPAIIADAQGRRDALAVTLFNVSLGWTAIG
jgi:Superinfection immunity protein